MVFLHGRVRTEDAYIHADVVSICSSVHCIIEAFQKGERDRYWDLRRVIESISL